MVQGEVVLITAPASEPVTRTEAKVHLRVNHTADDTLIDGLITAAREQVEAMSRRALLPQTLELRMARFPGSDRLVLPRPPLASVTSIGYTDEDGTTGTVSSDDYVVYAEVEPGEVRLKPAASWPDADLMPGPSVAVRYVAGYANAAAVPASLKQAILLLVGHWYENREAVQTSGATSMAPVPLAVEMLVNAERVSWF